MPTRLPLALLFLADGRPSIIAATHINGPGIYYEQDDPAIVDCTDTAALGASLRSALQRFSVREANLRDGKKSDWPAYRASHCPSIREFEERYLRCEVRAVNEAELFYDASCRPLGEAEITLHVTLNRYGLDEMMGKQIMRLFYAARRWHPDPPE
jgi:hypothetical protein